MKSQREQGFHQARRRRETVFLLLLVLVLVGWIEAVLRVAPEAVPPGEGATWSTLTERLYSRAGRELARWLEAHPETRDTTPRFVMLPVTGALLRRLQVASPNAEGLARHLEQLARAGGTAAALYSNRVAVARRVRAGEVGLRLHFTDFELAGDRVAATFAIGIEPAGRPAELVASAVRYEGTGLTLPWFIARRAPLPLRLLLGALGLALLVAGGWLGWIYYWLVEGRQVGPLDWVRPLNRLRAATGLIASSLALLTGFLLLVLTFLLAPSTGQALGVRRVHVDLVVDGDEFVLPQATYRQPTNALAATIADLGARVMGALEQRESTTGRTAAVEGRLDWLRHRLPDLLRRTETTLRINRGASWRIFAASEGQVVAADHDLQWPEPEPARRRRAIADTFDAIARRMPERGLGMPVPWHTNGLPPLDPATRAALADGDEAGRRATLVISAFQAPDRDYLAGWRDRCTNSRPAGERMYGLLLPGLARSANREWETFEGRVLTARTLCDRVAAAQSVPPEIATNDIALAALDLGRGGPPWPDFTAPVFAHDGLGARWIRNAAVPGDLTAEAAVRFAADQVRGEALDRLAVDFRDWLLAGREPVEQTTVFTIPRHATYLLVLALGLVFVVAGIRTEQNALGVPAWLPPVVVLVSGLALPAFASWWIHTRHDTTRFVVFGFADLAFWAALFLWMCAGVVPVFLGRARAGLPRTAGLRAVLAISLGLLAVAPLLPGPTRTGLAQAALATTFLLAGGALLAGLLRPRLGLSLALSLLLFLGVGASYLRLWGWAGQDLPAIGLCGVFLVAVASGWEHGLSWWQVTRHVEYDHIPWLRPAPRLLLAFVLTLAGSATLFCSFPARPAAGWIRDYSSYSLALAITPYLLCAGLIVLMDMLERDTH